MNPGIDEHKRNESSSDEGSPSMESTMTKSPNETKTPGHDSMVTVRLSEPPSLSVNTDLPVAVMPSRRSILGLQYTPTSAITLFEKEENTEVTGENARRRVDTEAPEIVQNELENDARCAGPEERGQDQDEMEDSDTEEVNWERLQETENEQVKDSDDNVRITYIFVEPRQDH